MKPLNLLTLICLLMGSCFFASCEKENLTSEEEVTASTQRKSLLETIKSNNDFSILYDAIVLAEMTATFEADKDYTFFAPDNNAFAAFLARQNWDSIAEGSTSQIKSIIEFHISDQGKVMSNQFTNGQKFKIMHGNYDVQLNLNDPEKPTAVLGLTSGIIITKDIEATNGVMHRIDGVLSL
ncbi:MAG: fasciclin domain-containing protein [Bacteroidota bacterium]